MYDEMCTQNGHTSDECNSRIPISVNNWRPSPDSAMTGNGFPTYLLIMHDHQQQTNAFLICTHIELAHYPSDAIINHIMDLYTDMMS